MLFLARYSIRHFLHIKKQIITIWIVPRQVYPQIVKKLVEAGSSD